MEGVVQGVRPMDPSLDVETLADMNQVMIPNTYRPPLGLPLSWHDEQRLVRAVTAYVDNRVTGTPIEPGDLELVRQYCEHYIKAPCWLATLVDQDDASDLRALRTEIARADTPEALSAWIQRCLELGIDPL